MGVGGRGVTRLFYAKLIGKLFLVTIFLESSNNIIWKITEKLNFWEILFSTCNKKTVHPLPARKYATLPPDRPIKKCLNLIVLIQKIEAVINDYCYKGSEMFQVDISDQL